MTAPEARRGGVFPLVATYITYGSFWGSWAVLFLEFIGAHRLSYGQLGWKIVFLTAAAVLAMVFLAPLMAHLRPDASLPISIAFYGTGILMLTLGPEAWLIPAFAICGIGTGLVDVFVNAVGHELESQTGTAVLQKVHAAYGGGAAFGALSCAIGLTLGYSFRQVLLFEALLQLIPVIVCLASPAFRNAPAVEPSDTKFSLSAFAKYPGLLVPALIVLSAFFIEGSLDVWSGTYLRSTLGASIMAAGIGVAAFGIATALGRGFASRILFSMGYRRTVLVSGIGSVAAGAAATLAPTPLVASFAYLFLGFFLAAAAPAAFGTVGGSGAQAGVSIAAITTVGYAGFVFGPPAMGWLAEAGGVQAVMVVITLSTLGIVAGGLLSKPSKEDNEPKNDVDRRLTGQPSPRTIDP
jgi:MFS family permease